MNTPADRQPTESVRASIQGLLSRLLGYAKAGGCAAEKFKEVQFALECLPLTTEEFAIATNRLENARGYLEAGEHGAASYELRLLARSLTGN